MRRVDLYSLSTWILVSASCGALTSWYARDARASAQGEKCLSTVRTMLAEAATVPSLNHGNVEAFFDPVVVSTSPAQITLDRAGGVPFTATLRKLKDPQDTMDNGMDSTYSITFQNVNEDQFNQLKTAYSGWSKAPSTVTFQQLAGDKKVIPALDMASLLPPLVQSLINRGFKDLTVKRPFSSVTNCWSTVYEIVRNAQTGPSTGYTLFFVPTDDFKYILNTYATPARTSVKKLSQLVKLSATERQKLLSPKDTIVFSIVMGKNVLPQHAAQWLDGNVVFERSGYSALNSVYRLNTLENILSAYGDTAVEIYKWDPAKPLPPITSVTLPGAQWSTDPAQGIYLKFPAPTFDPFITGNERPEFFDIQTSPTGKSTLIGADTDH